ncbi:MAG: hypothetical protein DIKNOCCD_02739 [bacterium]|nr:hypothetical protein [bacterium]
MEERVNQVRFQLKVLRLGMRDFWGGNYPFLVVLAVLLGCGTAGVRTLPPQYETVFIRMSNNSTLEYGAEERLTESLVEEFQRDGRLRQVNNWQDADLVLEVNIKKYNLRSVALNNDNRTAGRDLQLSVSAGARDPQSGLWVMPEQDFVDSGVFFLTNTPSGRREDDVYRRIGEQIISRLLEGWG